LEIRRSTGIGKSSRFRVSWTGARFFNRGTPRWRVGFVLFDLVGLFLAFAAPVVLVAFELLAADGLRGGLPFNDCPIFDPGRLDLPPPLLVFLTTEVQLTSHVCRSIEDALAETSPAAIALATSAHASTVLRFMRRATSRTHPRTPRISP